MQIRSWLAAHRASWPEWLLPGVPVVLAPLVLFCIPLLTGRVLFWGTPSLQFIPWQTYVWTQLQQGIFPMWNPLSGMGAPLIANYQLALFYPPGWLVYALASVFGASAIPWTNTLLIVLHLIWAGWGMSKLLALLGVSRLAQTIGSLAFSMSGFLIARVGFFSMIWSAAWLPWIVFAASSIARPGGTVTSKRIIFPFGLSLALGFQLLSGHAQLTWYSLILATAWVAVGSWQSGGWNFFLRSSVSFALAALAALLLAVVQLWPTFELLQQSQRAASIELDIAMTHSFWPWRLLTLFAPNFYGNPGLGNAWGYASFWEDAVYIGMLPMLLALSTLRAVFCKAPISRLGVTNRKPLLIFLWVFVLAGFILGMGKFTPLFPILFRKVPTFDMFQAPARFLLWSVFSLALLAGFGTDSLNQDAGPSLRALKRFTVAALAVALGAGVGWMVVKSGPSTMFSSTALAGLLAFVSGILILVMPKSTVKQITPWSWLVVAFVCFDLWAAGWLLNPVAPASLYHANDGNLEELQAALGSGRLYISPPDEYVLKFERFFRFHDFRPLEDWTHLRSVRLPNLNLLDGVPSANNFDPMVPARYARWMDALKGLPFVTQANWLREMAVSVVEELNVNNPMGVRFREVPGSERFQIYGCSQAVPNEEAAWAAVNENLGNGRMDCLIVEGADLPGTIASLSDIFSARMVLNTPNRIVFELQTGGGVWFKLADVWYPGWQAKVDGVETTIYRANYLYRGVFVPAGSHRLEFVYSPLMFIGAAFTSLVAWIIMLIGLIYSKYRLTSV